VTDALTAAPHRLRQSWAAAAPLLDPVLGRSTGFVVCRNGFSRVDLGQYRRNTVKWSGKDSQGRGTKRPGRIGSCGLGCLDMGGRGPDPGPAMLSITGHASRWKFNTYTARY
jgi:hypothetical protein